MSIDKFPNMQIAEQHVEALTGAADTPMHVRLIHETDKRAKKLYGTIKALWPQLLTAQKEGYGLFIVVNEGGSRNEEITKVRALYIDGDDIPLPETWHIMPDFLVVRSPVRWHAYWICQDVDLEKFEQDQRRLLTFYGADPAITNLSRVMRLAGSLHLKDQNNPRPVTIEILRENWEGKRTPEEILGGLPAVKTQHREIQKTAHDETDTKENIARAAKLLQDYVAKDDVAVEGLGGDYRTYQLFCEVQNLGISPEKSLDLIENIWNPHCLPPWAHDDLRVKSENAQSYAQNEAGAWAVAPAAETFKVALGKLALENSQPAPRSRFYFEDESEQDNAPDPVWLIKDLFPDNATILVSGTTGAFKSFIVQGAGLAVAAARETFETLPLRRGPVFYGAHEGRNEIKKARRLAWRLAHEVSGPIPFYVARAPQVASPEQCEDFREQIRARLREPGQEKIALIVLDTLAKCMIGMNENDAKDCGIFTAFCDSLKDEFECPVVALHHFGKDGKPRGSSALPANFDSVIYVTRIAGTKCVEVQVQQHKDADERETPWTFEGKPFAGSLVFFPTTPEEHRVLSGKADDIYDRKKVGAALRDLKAIGKENGVTRHVLATALTPHIEGKSVEDHQAAIEKVARVLKLLAHTKLDGYCEKEGRDFIWFLPAPVAKE